MESTVCSIMPALCFMLFIPYYVKNYAGIIDASLFIGKALTCSRNQNFHENFSGTYLTFYNIIGDSWVTIWHAESAKTFLGISLVSYYHIVQFHSLFIGKGFGIENSYINSHDFVHCI